jgi:hypothetical protein
LLSLSKRLTVRRVPQLDRVDAIRGFKNYGCGYGQETDPIVLPMVVVSSRNVRYARYLFAAEVPMLQRNRNRYHKNLLGCDERRRFEILILSSSWRLYRCLSPRSNGDVPETLIVNMHFVIPCRYAFFLFLSLATFSSYQCFQRKDIHDLSCSFRFLSNCFQGTCVACGAGNSSASTSMRRSLDLQPKIGTSVYRATLFCRPSGVSGPR